ncbi:MAG: sodium:proton antiporter, partial [Halomonas sp.]|nr:sodium:proton antiporter [Halomonas sp.]
MPFGCSTSAWPRSLRGPALLLLVVASLFASPLAHAATGPLVLTNSMVGFIAVALFVLAYALVMAEEKLHMRKSKPVLV